MRASRRACMRGSRQRAVLAGGGAAALAALLPGEALAHKRPHAASGAARSSTSRTVHRGLPGLHRQRADPPDARQHHPDGFYKQEWTFDEHSGTHMDAPGALHGRRPPDAGAEGERADPADRGDRHRQAGGVRSRHGGHRGGPAALREPVRPDPERRAGGDGLRAGPRRSATRPPSRAGRRAPTTSPASATRRSSSCSSGARRRRSASTR